MLVKYYADLTYDKVSEVDLTCSNAVEALSLLTSVVAPEFIQNLENNPYYFVMKLKDDSLISLNETMLAAEFPEGMQALLIMPEIEGDFDPISIGVAAAMGTSLAAATTLQLVAIYAITAVIMVGISYGLSMIMQALSPSQSYSNNTNPARTKASNLFNSRNMVRNQGGSVPVIFGNPHCSGVLIASGLTTEAI